MTKLELDFVRRTNFPWLAMVCFVLSLLFCASQAVVWYKWRGQIKRDEAQIERLERELKVKKRAAEAAMGAQRALLDERIKDEAKVLKATQYPWNRVLSTLEQADTGKVAVLSFAHDAATGDAKITAEAAEVAALEEFISRLNNGGEGEQGPTWYLASYQTQLQNVPPTVLGTILQKR
jgi:cell division protein FtsB